MAKIAYIDHSYHKKTVSTKFIYEILVERGHFVENFYDESWCGGESVKFSDVVNFDAIIMFQSYCDIGSGRFFSQLHPNVTYIPMLDQFGVWRGPIANTSAFWEKFHGSKVLNFSNSAHGMTVGMGIRSKSVRFYRKPASQPQKIKGLRGFLWVRLEDEISWSVVKKLIGETKFDSFHLHVAKDPGSRDIVMPSESDIKKYNITVTTWFEDKNDLEKILDGVNIYFSPRMEEGIGQSFLEALSRGNCVVAPNNGTMNEYIQNGFTGLLYDTDNLKPINFSDVQLIGMRAYESNVVGFKVWNESHDSILQFILMPNSDAYLGRYLYFNEYTELGSVNIKHQVFNEFKNKIRRYPFLNKICKKIKRLI